VNAVNLIPKERRGPHGRSSVSAPTLGLIGALALVLLAAVFYVSASNKVSVRRQQLAGVSAGVAGWTAAANSYQSYVTAAAQRASELGDVKVLAASRYPWATVLAQVGGLMPRDAALISLSATTPTPAAAGSTTAGSTAASPTTAATSGIQLSGCAATQSAVADTMVQLHRITGVANVTLSSTNESPTASSSSGSSAGGSCPFPVTFQIALEFANSAATTTAATSSTAGSSTTTTTTPATTGVAQ